MIPLTSITSLKRLFHNFKETFIPILETQVIEEVRLDRKRGGELSYLYGEVEEFLRRNGISVRDDSIPRPVKGRIRSISEPFLEAFIWPVDR